MISKYLWEGVPGIISVLIAAYLAARWSLGRFYSEKWWERKEKAYKEIIDALYDIVQYCKIEKEDYGVGTGYSETKMKELRERYSQAFWKINKATDLAAFVVPHEAESVLKELRNRPRLEWSENPPWEIFEQEYRYFVDALERIVDAARRDLKATKA